MTRVFLFCLVLALAKCAAPPSAPPVMACPTIPTARPSLATPVLPPISARPMALQPAHWDWVDGGYVWMPAAWMERTAPWQPVWVNGFWTPNGGGCAWTSGHFLR